MINDHTMATLGWCINESTDPHSSPLNPFWDLFTKRSEALPRFARFVINKTNTLAGTPEYMAPEAKRSRKRASDLELGVSKKIPNHNRERVS